MKLVIKVVPRIPNGDDGFGWGSGFFHVWIFHNKKMVMEVGTYEGERYAKDHAKMLRKIIRMAQKPDAVRKLRR